MTPGGDRAAVADVLGRLVDKSLVARRRADGRWCLLDTVRAYALDRLAASGEHDEVRERYLAWAVAGAEALEERLRERPGSWRDAFDAVADDLRAALARVPPGPQAAHRLARSLGRLTYARRFLAESVEHFGEAVRRAPGPAEAAADLRTRAHAGVTVGLADRSFALLEAAAERAGAAGDRDARAIALAGAVVTAHRFPSGFAEAVPRGRLDALLREATASGASGSAVAAAHLAAAEAWHARPPDPGRTGAAVAAARDTGDPVLLSGALDLLGRDAERAGRLPEVRHIARDRLALVERMDRDDPAAAAEILDAFHFAWLCALAAGDLPAALSTARAIGADDLLGAHPYRPAGKLIPPLVLAGRHDEALERAEPMWRGWRRSGAPVAVWLSFAASAVALAHGLRGDEAAFRLWRDRAAQALGTGHRARHAAFAAFVDASVAVRDGAMADAPEVVARAFTADPGGWQAAYARAAGAELAVVAGLPDAAERLAAATAAADGNAWAAACCARARGRLRGDAGALDEAMSLWDRIDARFESARTRRLLIGRGAGGPRGVAARRR